MRENFDACLSFTLKYEGGYVNHPRDPGGPTNMGITQVTLSRELGRHASATDVRALSPALAKAIYRKSYWAAIDGDTHEKGVDLMLFDICVNMGPGRSRQFHDKTKALKGAARVRALHDLRMGFWRSLRTWATFGKGWTSRENACLALALQMASESH